MVEPATPEPLPVFSYGSNLCLERIRARAPSVEVLGTGYVTGRRLAFHKIGVDGSGKADAFFTGREADRVWGTLHRMSPTDRIALDACEGGYELERVEVVRKDGGRVPALAYVALASRIAEQLTPWCWYLDYVLRGARELGLPSEYLEAIRAFPCARDPRGPA